MLVTLQEAKQYLRIDYEDDNALLQTLVLTAERLCADILRREDVAEVGNEETVRSAVLYTVGYLYENRAEADHNALDLTLRALLFGGRKEMF